MTDAKELAPRLRGLRPQFSDDGFDLSVAAMCEEAAAALEAGGGE